MLPSRTRAEVAACPRCGRVWAPVWDAPLTCVTDGARLTRQVMIPERARTPELDEILARRGERLGGVEETTARIGQTLARLEEFVGCDPDVVARLGRLEAAIDEAVDEFRDHDRFVRSAASVLDDLAR
jgi:hypothetical protein